MEHVESAEIPELPEQAEHGRRRPSARRAVEARGARRVERERAEGRALTAPAAARRSVQRLERAISSAARERDRGDLAREPCAGDRIALLERVGPVRRAGRRQAPHEPGVSGADDREQSGARALLIGEAREPARHHDEGARVRLELGAPLERLDEERDRLRRPDRRRALDAADALVGIAAADEARGVLRADARAEVRRLGPSGRARRRAGACGGAPWLRLRADRERGRDGEEGQPSAAQAHGFGAGWSTSRAPSA